MKRFVNILLLLLTTLALHAQRVQELCKSTAAVEYSVTGDSGMVYHWNPIGGTFANADTLNDTVKIYWNDIGLHTLSVFGELHNCLTDSMFINVNILPVPDNFTLGVDRQLCLGQDSVTFDIDKKYSSIEWSNHTSAYSFTANNSDTVWATVKSDNKCTFTDSALIKAYAPPSVNLGVDTAICGEDHISLFAQNTGDITYKWSVIYENFKKETPEIKDTLTSLDPYMIVGKGRKKYAVEVTRISEGYACVATDTIEIKNCAEIFDKEKVPVVITPNGDGKNEIWVIPGLAYEYPKAVVEIYDRWGRIVFRSKPGYSEPWSGRDNIRQRQLPMDTYFYVINLNNKEKSVAVGNILIVR